MSAEEKTAMISTNEVEKLMLNIRGMNVLLDRDVAMLYGVETRDYILELMPEEKTQLVEDFHRFNSLKHSTSLPKAFTERGLYMLATILKSPRAIEATIAIIDTFSMTRQLSRTMVSLQNVEDGCEQQKGLLQKTGEILADIVGRNLTTSNTETEIEFNFAIVKIKHKITRDKE